jgi:hypothetical protein
MTEQMQQIIGFCSIGRQAIKQLQTGVELEADIAVPFALADERFLHAHLSNTTSKPGHRSGRRG